MYKTQIAHKAKHGGYRSKPSKSQIKAQMNMYASISETTVITPVKKQAGVQLKMDL